MNTLIWIVLTLLTATALILIRKTEEAKLEVPHRHRDFFRRKIRRLGLMRDYTAIAVAALAMWTAMSHKLEADDIVMALFAGIVAAEAWRTFNKKRLFPLAFWLVEFITIFLYVLLKIKWLFVAIIILTGFYLWSKIWYFYKNR